VLSIFLACDDPYLTAEHMTGTLGWRLEFATPRESDDKVASVSLGDAHVMLSTAEDKYLPAAARDHRGAGITVYVRLPAVIDITDVHARHAAGGVVTAPLTERPWGERAFDAVIAGYRFLIAQ
jgi:uncharacterized glyoxalase superfamily protein PhnB